MSVKPDPKKQGHFIIDCRPDGYKGKRMRLRFEGSEEEAQDYERMIIQKPVAQTAATAKTISGIWPHFFRQYELNRGERTSADFENVWDNHLKLFFGQLQPKVLTRQLIEKYKEQRLKTGVKPRTINKELSYFSGFLNWAADNEFCERIPFRLPLFPAKMERAPKPRPLSPSEVTELLANVKPAKFRLPVLLMVDAGLRVSEALTLTREQIEWQHGVIFVVGKGSKERIVPITTDRLMTELMKYLDTKGYLLVNKRTKRPYGSIEKTLKNAAKEAGIKKKVTHHLLRHTFGTNATVAGYDLSALQAIMGHSSVQTTGIYQHLAGDYLREQGRKLNDLAINSVHVDKNEEDVTTENNKGNDTSGTD